MSQNVPPPPLTPAALLIAAPLVSLHACAELMRLWDTGQQPDDADAAILMAVSCIERDGAVYVLTVRGYQVAGWWSGKGLTRYPAEP